MAGAVSVQEVPLAFLPRASAPRLRPTRHVRRSVARPHLSVVIVNYRQWRGTAELVRQLRGAECLRDGRAEVIIVDNHSPPHRLGARLRQVPGVSLRRWQRNHGFARAVNEGCRLGSGEWCLLLNPDVSVDRPFLDQVLAAAERLTAADPRTGIIGFQLHNSDGTLQLSSGSFPTLVGTLSGLLRPRCRRKYRSLPLSRPSRTPWVTGCCFLVRRSCLQQLGGFDEGFFLYYEDVDLCRRARALGWSVWYDPTLHATHHRPLHARTVSAPLRVVTRHALLHYAARHWPTWQSRLLARVVRLEAGLRRRWTHWHGLAGEAALFAQLQSVAADMAHGRERQARRRVRQLMHREERATDG